MLGPLLLLDLLAGLKVAQALRACCAMFIYILLCLCIYIYTHTQIPYNMSKVQCRMGVVSFQLRRAIGRFLHAEAPDSDFGF